MKFLPSRCPDCKSPMIFIDYDCTNQGGPPENTWLCSIPECGKALDTYKLKSEETICLLTLK